jgi:hypothetical protein
MNPTKILYHWFGTVSKSFTALSRPEAFVLAAFSLGLAAARSCTLSRVAGELYWLGKTATVERRLQRFLSNPRINWQLGCQNLAGWVLAHLGGGRQPLVLLVDETALGERLKTMAVSLAYHGRALPLAWWCYPEEHYPMKQVRLIDTLLGWVAPFIPPGREVLVEADRGIGTSPALLRCIELRGWRYLVRVQDTVALVQEGTAGTHAPFRSLLERPGQSWAGWVWAFKKAGWRRCWAIAYWGYGHQEPWLLLSDQPGFDGQAYGWRMWEELAFRDFKSNGWHWHKSHVWDPAHANRLWLVMALAYVWAISLGTCVREQTRWWCRVARGAKTRVSLFKLGLRWLSQCLHGQGYLFYKPRLNYSFQ